MRKKVMLTALAITASVWPSVSHAGPIFAGFPPPGGASFSASGSLTDSPGRMRSYGGFTPAGNWDALYFNIETGSLGGPTTPTPVTFNADYPVDGGSWFSQLKIGNTVRIAPSMDWSFFDFSTGGYTTPVGIYLNLDFFQADGTTPLLSSDIIVSTPGDGMPLFVLQISPAKLAAWGGGFTVNQLYTVINGMDASDWFASHNGGGGNLQASTTAAFWFDPPTSSAVPEPGSLILLGTGLIAVASRVRRGKNPLR